MLFKTEENLSLVKGANNKVSSRFFLIQEKIRFSLKIHRFYYF